MRSVDPMSRLSMSGYKKVPNMSRKSSKRVRGRDRWKQSATYFRKRGADRVADFIDAGDLGGAKRALEEFLQRRLAEPVAVRPNVAVPADGGRKSEEAVRADGMAITSRSFLRETAATLKSDLGRENGARIERHRGEVVAFMRSKWADILSSNRHFGLPIERHIDIEVSTKCLTEIGLRTLRFRQQGFRAPEIGVDLIGENREF